MDFHPTKRHPMPPPHLPDPPCGSFWANHQELFHDKGSKSPIPPKPLTLTRNYSSKSTSLKQCRPPLEPPQLTQFNQFSHFSPQDPTFSRRNRPFVVMTNFSPLWRVITLHRFDQIDHFNRLPPPSRPCWIDWWRSQPLLGVCTEPCLVKRFGLQNFSKHNWLTKWWIWHFFEDSKTSICKWNRK